MDGLPLNKVLLGNCVEVMQEFPSDSIDLVVTSPAYWGLRDYGVETVRVWGDDPKCRHEWAEQVDDAEGYTSRKRWQHGKTRESNPEGWSREVRKYAWCQKCGAWRGSLGLEPHPQMYIDHLVEICRGIRRVLKPSGSFWLNLGDTYYGSGGKGGQYEKFSPDKGQPAHFKQNSKARSNWLQPKQLLSIPWRVAIALQHDGWILRNAIVWHKPNHMPSSVKDRLTNAYEFVFMLVKQGKYYFDLDAIRKPHQLPHDPRKTRGDSTVIGRKEFSGRYLSPDLKPLTNMRFGQSPRGKNPGDVWTIPTTPFPGAHFATFPPKLIEPIVKAGCPKGGVVLDPFCGSGTVGRVARRLRRNFILIDIKPEYCEMAERRIRGQKRGPPEGVVPLEELFTLEE